MLAIGLVATTLIAGCSSFPSKGTMPPPGPDGVVDASAAPDFLAVGAGGGGVAGYARKEDVLGPGNAPFPVYAEDLATVVGQMVPGKGFVPAGVDPAAVPTFRVEVAPSPGSTGTRGGQVVLYLRNDATAQAWVSVQVGGQASDYTGFWGQNRGVGCYTMPAGSRLVLLDRSPQQPGAVVVRQLYVRGQETDRSAPWMSIGKDGSVDQGTGDPDWWGGPAAC